MHAVDRDAAARVLGVAPTATPEQVRDAFRRRARRVHPDTVGGDAASMVELNAAYRTLSMPRGIDWEFARRSAPEPPDSWIAPPVDVPVGPPDGSQAMLRYFWIALILAGTVATTIVFVAAIGYDWSLSP